MRGFSLSRRSLLAGAGGLAVGAAVPRLSFAQDAVEQFSWGVNNPGFTTLIARYIVAEGLDRKHGFALDAPIDYRSVPTYYNDFIAGSYDLCQMDWNSAANMYLQGVPLKFICKMTTGSMIAIVARKGTVAGAADLAGKVVVGQQSTGAYRMTRALIQEAHGFDLEAEATVQSVTTGSAGVNLVRAGQAAAALTWEPHLSYALDADPDLEIVVNVGAMYEEVQGRPLPYFGVAISQDLAGRDPTVVERINAIFGDAASGIMADVSRAVGMMDSGGEDNFSPEILEAAITSGRLRFDYGSTAEEGARGDVEAAIEFFHEHGVVPGLVDDDYFA